MSVRLGIDLGGTSAKIALVTKKGQLIRDCSVPTAGFPPVTRLVQKMSAEIRNLLRGQSISQIGIGVAGDINFKEGIVRVSPNLGWKNVPLKKMFRKYFRCPIVVENDANAAAWGIYKLHVSKNVKNVVVMTLGTGVGGGIILEGKLFRGFTGSAGEIGHMNIDEKGPLCNCGNRGCLETYVGGPHLIKKANRDLAMGQRSSLQKLFKQDPRQITPYRLAQAAKKGDAYALSIWKGVGHALGVAVGDLVYLLNPEMIYFTGGLAQAGTLFLKPLHHTLNKRAFKTPVRAVQIKCAKEASHIGVVGAALL
ncbi:MAG: Glucokinase [Elusimicrobia bacterium]|nr:Glucokinase [Elusimicrobiota bacterium]